MKSLTDILYALLGIALLSALIAGTYFAIQFVIKLFTGLNPQVAAIIYAAVVILLFSAIVISAIVRWSQNRGRMDALRAERSAVYRRFVEASAAVLSQRLSDDIQNAEQREANLRASEKQLVLWGSRGVIKHYMAYRKQDTMGNPRDPAVQPHLEKVLLEIRKDLGQSNIGLNGGDLLELLIGDSYNLHGSNNSVLHKERHADLPV